MKGITSDMSEPASIEATVRRVVAAVVDESEDEVVAQPILAAHAWDSLSTLEALAQLENELDIILDLRSYHAARTLDELVALVTAAVNAKTALQH